MFAPSPTEPQRLVLGGWQARIVPGLEPPTGEDAKYLSATGMQKSELLYGLHLAIAAQGPVYVVKGPSDCWRIGPGAVAIFGKTLATTQKLLLVHHFVGRPIVMMLDPDARQSAEQIQRELALARGHAEGDNRVVIADVPSHREDPADCTRDEIIAAANAALMRPACWRTSQAQEDCRW
jgi:DNA primase